MRRASSTKSRTASAVRLIAALACAAYVQGGLDSLVATADGLAGDLAAHADFRNGLAVGGVFTLIFAAALRLGGRGRAETTE